MNFLPHDFMADLDDLTGRRRYARPNRVEVDLAAIAHNVGAVRRVVGDKTRIFAALKGNGYGFGRLAAADTVAAAGADALSVADLEDAIALREHGLRLPILVYAGNLMTPEMVEAAAGYDLMPTVHDRLSLQAVAAHAGALLRVFVKTNVGLERFGFEPDEVAAVIARLRDHPRVEVTGIYTHLHVPKTDRPEPYLGWQYERFQAAVRAVEEAGGGVPLRLLASSQVLGLTAGMTLDAVDPGHLLFGLDPASPLRAELELRPALGGFTTRLVQARALVRDRFVAEAPVPVRSHMRVGVIPLGFADGFAALHCGQVLVRGRRAGILKPHSAEHTRIDLTQVPDAEVGDEVVVIGGQGAQRITLEEVARHQGHPRHVNVTMAIPASIPRVYAGGEGTAAAGQAGIAERREMALR